MIPRFISLSLIVVLFASWAVNTTSVLATPITIGDVTFADHESYLSKNLVLNGAGIRKKFIFKVYAAALYLEKKTNTENELFNAASGIKKLEMVFLRDVGKEKMLDTFKEGMTNNKIPASKDLDVLFSAISDIKEKEKMIFTIDGDKLNFEIQQKTGTITNATISQSWLKLWLGESPADSDLKKALLGQ